MARARLTALPTPVGVLVGGMCGGGIRLGIDAAVPTADIGFPLDIAVINLIGAFLLAVMTAWATTRGYRHWMPALGTGALGTFTTFATLAALPWVASTSPVPAVAFVMAVIVASIGAAAAGWQVGDRLALLRPSERP